MNMMMSKKNNREMMNGFFLHKNLHLVILVILLILVSGCIKLPEKEISPTPKTIIWDEDKYVKEDYHVTEGTSLTIKPGVTVYITPGAEIRVDGCLTANGTKNKQIVFTTLGSGYWRGLTLSNDYNSSILRHCKIERAGIGITIFSSLVTISDCNITSTGSVGIECLWASPKICNNVISSNRGKGILCSYSTTCPIIVNNTISNNTHGIVCDRASPTLRNNTLCNNRLCSISIPYNSKDTIARMSNNTVDGVQLESFYYLNKTHLTIERKNYNWGDDRTLNSDGFITLYNCSDILVSNCSLSNNFGGIKIHSCLNISVSGCSLSNNSQGVEVYSSSAVTIINSTMSNNDVGVHAENSEISLVSAVLRSNEEGIVFDGSTGGIENTSISNSEKGITCFSSSPTVENSTILNSTYDVYVSGSSHPKIYNTFFNPKRSYIGDFASTIELEDYTIRSSLEWEVNDTSHSYLFFIPAVLILSLVVFLIGFFSKPKKREKVVKIFVYLFIAFLIPFSTVTLALYSFPIGVHGNFVDGEGASYYLINETAQKGESYSEVERGYWSGEGYFGEDDGNYGWVICDGKIRHRGTLTLHNASFHYEKTEGYWEGSMSIVDYQGWKIEGNKGTMEEGFPIYYLGILAGCFGMLLYSFVFFFTQKWRLIVGGSILGSISTIGGLAFVFPLLAFSIFAMICFSPFIIGVFVVIVIIIWRSQKGLNLSLLFPKVTLTLGCIAFIGSLLFLLNPTSSDAGMANGLVERSTIWLILSLFAIGVGIAFFKRKGTIEEDERQKQRERQVPSSPIPAPLCPHCNKHLSYLSQYKKWYCSSCGKYVTYITPQPFVCPICGNPLDFIPTYGRWYCRNCKKYSPL